MGRFIVGLAAAALLLGAGRAGADVVNGGFETGDFTGWTDLGFLNPAGGPSSGGPNYATFLAAQAAGTPKADSNAVVASQTSAFDGNGAAGPPVGPTQGQFLAFISNETSAGDGTLTGSSILQTFTIPSNAMTLGFDARLLNNDIPIAFSSNNDFGGVALTSGSQVVAQFNLDLDPASTADAHVTAGASVGGFLNSTPWLSPGFDVYALRGQTVTLTAYALNYGDNFVETRLLFDNVHFTAVPEPGVLALSGVGLSGLLVLLLGRRKPAA